MVWLALFGGGIVAAGWFVVWLRTPALGTFEDECFLPTYAHSSRGFTITQYEYNFHCRGGRSWTHAEQWLESELAERILAIESSERRAQLEIQKFRQARESCSQYADDCALSHLGLNPVECIARRLSSAPWREQALAYDALIHEKRLQLEAEETARCILFYHHRRFVEGCTPGTFAVTLTQEECCTRGRERRGPDVLSRLLPLGVSCSTPEVLAASAEPHF